MIFIAGAVVVASRFVLADSKPPLPTVSQVDLSRYVGKWYEIARYPNRFEKKCASDVTASYSQKSNGRIEVVNSCRQADGKIKVSKGEAKVVDKSSNAKLKVAFFKPFYGDYWIVDIAPDYSYAVVGEPSRRYLWILSRTPRLPDETYQKIEAKLAALGYDRAKLVKTAQSQD